MSHDEVLELAGLFVLGALSSDEESAVRDHLRSCALDHAELIGLGSAAQALALAVEPQDAPAGARARILDAIGRESGRPLPTQPRADVRQSPVTSSRMPALFGIRRPTWVALAAAMALVAALGAWSLQINARAEYLEQRGETIARVMAASVEPGAEVALLKGSGNASAAAGIAVVDASQQTHIVLAGLPPAPAGQTYQAWHISGGVARSAGLLTVDGDGYAVLAGVSTPAGTEVVALTLEVAGGVDAPTAAPIISGSLGGG